MSDITLRSDMGVELIQHMGDDMKIAQAARVSTLGLENEREKFEGLVRALIRDKHWSPLEHCQLTFAFDVPLFVRDQIVRHKSLAFSVFSLRYAGAKPAFWIPADQRPLVQVGKALDYRRTHGSYAQSGAAQKYGRRIAEESWAAYREMVETGIANEVARAVLPTSLYTQMWATGSLRSWLHFLDVRNDEHAQWEIREAAAKVEEIISELFPVAWRAWLDTKEEETE